MNTRRPYLWTMGYSSPVQQQPVIKLSWIQPDLRYGTSNLGGISQGVSIQPYTAYTPAVIVTKAKRAWAYLGVTLLA